MAENSIPPMLTVDGGLSDTKVVWRVTPFRPELLMMNPEVFEVSRSAIDFYKSRRVTSCDPENEAWVECEGGLYAVGFLAQKHFHARVALLEPKYEWAIAKVLAAVGVMAIKEALPDNFSLALAMPLPYGEWEDRKRFERDVAKALSDFTFCDQHLSVDLSLFTSVPEGGGHVMARGQKLGSSFNQKKIISLMWGYRDISVVQFNRGVISGQTEPMGFFQLIEMVKERISGYNSVERERLLLETIHACGKDVKSKNFKSLALSRNNSRRTEEVEQITEAIGCCRHEYWEMICRLFQNRIPSDAHEIIIGGGSFDYYRSELRHLLAEKFPRANISWGADLEEDVRTAFNLPPTAKALCARLTDAYGLSNFLRHQVCPVVVAQGN